MQHLKFKMPFGRRGCLWYGRANRVVNFRNELRVVRRKSAQRRLILQNDGNSRDCKRLLMWIYNPRPFVSSRSSRIFALLHRRNPHHESATNWTSRNEGSEFTRDRSRILWKWATITYVNSVHNYQRWIIDTGLLSGCIVENSWGYNSWEYDLSSRNYLIIRFQIRVIK